MKEFLGTVVTTLSGIGLFSYIAGCFTAFLAVLGIWCVFLIPTVLFGFIFSQRI